MKRNVNTAHTEKQGGTKWKSKEQRTNRRQLIIIRHVRNVADYSISTETATGKRLCVHTAGQSTSKSKYQKKEDIKCLRNTDSEGSRELVLAISSAVHTVVTLVVTGVTAASVQVAVKPAKQIQIK